jgi:hypothetical protein
MVEHPVTAIGVYTPNVTDFMRLVARAQGRASSNQSHEVIDIASDRVFHHEHPYYAVPI